MGSGSRRTGQMFFSKKNCECILWGRVVVVGTVLTNFLYIKYFVRRPPSKTVLHNYAISMDGLGTITWEEFVDDAESMVRLSDGIDDSWEIVGDKTSPGMAYLSRQVKTYVPCDYPIDEAPTTSEDEDWIKNLDASMGEDPFEAPSKAERPLIILHHVLWSMSYSVPVLYFNGWKSDFPGCNPVSVEAAQRLIKGDVLGYSELSQAIHPILGTPFLQLHPCKSQELLRHVCKSKNKLVSWLSAAAPAALGLKIREDYYELTAGKSAKAGL